MSTSSKGSRTRSNGSNVEEEVITEKINGQASSSSVAATRSKNKSRARAMAKLENVGKNDSVKSTYSLSIFLDPEASKTMPRHEEMTYTMYEIDADGVPTQLDDMTDRMKATNSKQLFRSQDEIRSEMSQHSAIADKDTISLGSTGDVRGKQNPKASERHSDRSLSGTEIAELEKAVRSKRFDSEASATLPLERGRSGDVERASRFSDLERGRSGDVSPLSDAVHSWTTVTDLRGADKEKKKEGTDMKTTSQLGASNSSLRSSRISTTSSGSTATEDGVNSASSPRRQTTERLSREKVVKTISEDYPKEERAEVMAREGDFSSIVYKTNGMAKNLSDDESTITGESNDETAVHRERFQGRPKLSRGAMMQDGRHAENSHHNYPKIQGNQAEIIMYKEKEKSISSRNQSNDDQPDYQGRIGVKTVGREKMQRNRSQNDYDDEDGDVHTPNSSSSYSEGRTGKPFANTTDSLDRAELTKSSVPQTGTVRRDEGVRTPNSTSSYHESTLGKHFTNDTGSLGRAELSKSSQPQAAARRDEVVRTPNSSSSRSNKDYRVGKAFTRATDSLERAELNKSSQPQPAPRLGIPVGVSDSLSSIGTNSSSRDVYKQRTSSGQNVRRSGNRDKSLSEDSLSSSVHSYKGNASKGKLPYGSKGGATGGGGAAAGGEGAGEGGTSVQVKVLTVPGNQQSRIVGSTNQKVGLMERDDYSDSYTNSTNSLGRRVQSKKLTKTLQNNSQITDSDETDMDNRRSPRSKQQVAVDFGSESEGTDISSVEPEYSYDSRKTETKSSVTPVSGQVIINNTSASPGPPRAFLIQTPVVIETTTPVTGILSVCQAENQSPPRNRTPMERIVRTPMAGTITIPTSPPRADIITSPVMASRMEGVISYSNQLSNSVPRQSPGMMSPVGMMSPSLMKYGDINNNYASYVNQNNQNTADFANTSIHSVSFPTAESPEIVGVDPELRRAQKAGNQYRITMNLRPMIGSSTGSELDYEVYNTSVGRATPIPTPSYTRLDTPKFNGPNVTRIYSEADAGYYDQPVRGTSALSDRSWQSGQQKASSQIAFDLKLHQSLDECGIRLNGNRTSPMYAMYSGDDRSIAIPPRAANNTKNHGSYLEGQQTSPPTVLNGMKQNVQRGYRTSSPNEIMESHKNTINTRGDGDQVDFVSTNKWLSPEVASTTRQTHVEKNRNYDAGSERMERESSSYVTNTVSSSRSARKSYEPLESTHSSHLGSLTQSPFVDSEFDRDLQVGRDSERRRSIRSEDYDSNASRSSRTQGDVTMTITQMISNLDLKSLILNAPPNSIRQTIDKERLEDEIVEPFPPDKLPFQGSARTGSIGDDPTSPLDYDKVNEEVDMDVRDGKAMLISKVHCERVVPIMGTDELYKKSAMVVTKVTEIDLEVTPQRQQFYKTIIQGKATLTKDETLEIYKILSKLAEMDKAYQ